MPSKLTREQKAALQSFDDSSDIKQTPQMKQYRDNLSTMYGVDPYNS